MVSFSGNWAVCCRGGVICVRFTEVLRFVLWVRNCPGFGFGIPIDFSFTVMFQSTYSFIDLSSEVQTSIPCFNPDM